MFVTVMAEGGKREKQPDSIFSSDKSARDCTLLQTKTKRGKLRKKSKMWLEEVMRDWDQGWRRARERMLPGKRRQMALMWMRKWSWSGPDNCTNGGPGWDNLVEDSSRRWDPSSILTCKKGIELILKAKDGEERIQATVNNNILFNYSDNNGGTLSYTSSVSAGFDYFKTEHAKET